jgi:hypothetical protein
MSGGRDVFQIYDIDPGESGLDYDIDCRPWLEGAATMSSVELEQEPGDPVVYDSPVALFDGGRSAKFIAACPDGTLPTARFVRVKLTDNQGRVGRQWFQMTVG